MAQKKSTAEDVARRRQMMNNLKGVVEAMYLAATLDGSIDDGERAMLVEMAVGLFSDQVEPGRIHEILEKIEGTLGDEDVSDRIEAIARRFSDDEGRRYAVFAVAHVLASSEVQDGEEDGEELDFFNSLAEHLGVDAEYADHSWNCAVENLQEKEHKAARIEAATLAACVAMCLDESVNDDEIDVALKIMDKAIPDSMALDSDQEAALRERFQGASYNDALEALSSFVDGQEEYRALALEVLARLLSRDSGEGLKLGERRNVFLGVAEKLGADEKETQKVWKTWAQGANAKLLEAAVLAAEIAICLDETIDSEELELAIGVMSKLLPDDIDDETIKKRYFKVTKNLTSDTRHDALARAIVDDECRALALEVGAQILVKNDRDGSKLSRRHEVFMGLASAAGASDEEASAQWKKLQKKKEDKAKKPAAGKTQGKPRVGAATRAKALPFLQPTVEIAVLAANADGTVEESELSVVSDVIMSQFEGEVSKDKIDRLVRDAMAAIKKDGTKTRMLACAEQLTDDTARECAVMWAVSVLLADPPGSEEDLDAEIKFYNRLVSRLGMSKEQGTEIWNTVYNDR